MAPPTGRGLSAQGKQKECQKKKKKKMKGTETKRINWGGSAGNTWGWFRDRNSTRGLDQKKRPDVSQKTKVPNQNIQKKQLKKKRGKRKKMQFSKISRWKTPKPGAGGSAYKHSDGERT